MSSFLLCFDYSYALGLDAHAHQIALVPDIVCLHIDLFPAVSLDRKEIVVALI